MHATASPMQSHWVWLAIGFVAAFVIMFLARMAGAGHGPRTPAAWYAEHRSVRRLMVNVVGLLLIVGAFVGFSWWLQPSMTRSKMFPSPVIGPQGVDVARAQEQTLEQTVTYTGTVKPFQDAIVAARVPGWVKTLNVYPGDHVISEQVLLTLETSVQQPKLSQARADVEYWAAEFAREEMLFKAGAISTSERDHARDQMAAAKAKLALNQTDISYANLRAPMTGVISERDVYPGAYVQNGAKLLKVEQLDKVRIQFNVAEDDLGWIHPGSTIYLHFPEEDPALIRRDLARALGQPPENSLAEDPIVAATVAAVFPEEDAQTHTGLVEVRVDNPDGILKDNTYVVGDLVRRRAEHAVVVPASALTSTPDGMFVVFVAPANTTQGPVQERKVKVGLRTDRQAQILQGVHAGEMVVTRGNRQLADGQPVLELSR